MSEKKQVKIILEEGRHTTDRGDAAVMFKFDGRVLLLPFETLRLWYQRNRSYYGRKAVTR